MEVIQSENEITIKMSKENASTFLDELYEMLEMTRPDTIEDDPNEGFPLCEDVWDKLSDGIGFVSPFMRK